MSVVDPAHREAARDEREPNAVLRFPAVSIAVHALLRGIPLPLPAADDRFSYHQRELLSYAHRDTPPLVMRPLELPAPLTQVAATFPEVDYSAGELKRLPARPEAHRFEVLAAITHFPSSGTSVLTVVLRDPDADAEVARSADPLTEFGAIRLAKLWEAGESAPDLRSTAHGGGLLGGSWVTFATPDGDSLAYASLIDRVRHAVLRESEYVLRPARQGGTPDRPYVTGSVQLRTEPGVTSRLAEGIRSLQNPMLDCDDPAELIALSGVLRALISFDDTHRHELPSIFRDTVATNRLITAVHKGTFLRLAESMRMPSAYFLLPHTIALHNEALLDVAVESGSALLEARAGETPRPARAADPLVAARRAVSTALAHCVDAEAIHYPNLRDLYERAARSRGLDALEARARRYADELTVEAAGVRARQQAFGQTAIAAIALVFAAVQIKDTVPLVVGLPLAIVLAVVSVLVLPGLSLPARRARR
ncbi:MAG: hypothetical protein QOG63_254 [Thermoleophilaceae bacterium]|jgi:hypothetical protein|nr:hypothetical protein [Thermoleophilaceae bacterium]